MKRNDYIRYDNQFYRPKRKKIDMAVVVMLSATLALALAVVGLGVFTFLDKRNSDPTDDLNMDLTTDSLTDPIGIIIATPTPTPIAERLSYQNPVLYPASAHINTEIGMPSEGLSPLFRGAVQDVFLDDQTISNYSREPGFVFEDPLHYQWIPGILTFRGNNFRNCASWGSIGDSPQGELIQTWEYRNVGSLPSSAWAFSWGGTGWTGQPLVIEWDYDVQQLMNMYPDKRIKQGLIEVIQVALDGKIYFFDIEDGTFTREPINLGATIKGTAAVDPRGYPLLYVGQGDNNGADGKFGFYIFSLIDGEMLHYQAGLDARAHRRGWGAADSSPLVCAETDTVIFPSENGLLYTVELNTVFDQATGELAINPETIVYRYQLNGISGGQMGIESSIAVYGHYGYFSDNSGNLFCVDLNTFEMIWALQLDDDTDVTPVLEEENGRVYLYTGTEVDWQRDIVGYYQGAAYTYKIDAMTGEEIWQTSYPCWTRKAADSGDDLNGGVLGTPIIGKHSISNMVIFSYAMTNGAYSGNVLVAYNKISGEQIWVYEMNMYSWSSPVDVYDDEGNAYIVMCDSIGQIHFVDAQTGERITFLQTMRNKGLENETTEGLNMESSPVVYNDMIVIGTRSGSVFGVRIT